MTDISILSCVVMGVFCFCFVCLCFRCSRGNAILRCFLCWYFFIFKKIFYFIFVFFPNSKTQYLFLAFVFIYFLECLFSFTLFSFQFVLIFYLLPYFSLLFSFSSPTTKLDIYFLFLFLFLSVCLIFFSILLSVLIFTVFSLSPIFYFYSPQQQNSIFTS